MKQNDWLVATINNPGYDPLDFRYISGMNLDNTQLLPQEDYLKSPYIQRHEVFQDEQGGFDEKKFKDIYKEAATTFSEFSEEDDVDNYKYGMWDVLKPEDAEVKDEGFTISKETNPDHITIGISGINDVASSGLSRRELAQRSKIYDTASGKFLDKSVNDVSLIKSPVEFIKRLVDEPLVYATYDEDTVEIDKETGDKILHKKGEWKVNDEGEYYTETLNGRSLVGKMVVSSQDFLTPEDSAINKYDFMDSDSLDKSATGVIAKQVMAILPLFMGGYVKGAYAGLMIARELIKSMPMLYGVITGLTGEKKTDNKLLNTMAAYGQEFSTSTTDYARTHTFSFENFGNLMSDVALQWVQQRAIANTFLKITGGNTRAINAAYAKAAQEYQKQAANLVEQTFQGKVSPQKMFAYIGTNNIMEIPALVKSGKFAESLVGKAAIGKYVPKAQELVQQRLRLGQDLSLAYMAIISNTDVYDMIKLHGGTPFEAALMTLGSTVGMFSVDKFLGLGEMFFQDEPARKALRLAARQTAAELMTTMGAQGSKKMSQKAMTSLLQKGVQAGKNIIKNYRQSIKDRSLGIVGKSIGEGLEEVSEELVTDFSRTLGEIAGQLGYFSQTDYGAWDNAFDRYVMNFLGGAAGGGLFGMIDVHNNLKNTQDLQFDLIYLLRQGKKKEILNEFDKMKKKGQLGSTSLSFETEEDSNGNRTYLTAQNVSDTQNAKVHDVLVKTLNQLDFILKENSLDLTDNEVFDKLVQGEYRAMALTDFMKGDKEGVKNMSYVTRYQEDFQNLANRIVDVQSRIDQMRGGTDTSKREPGFDEEFQKLMDEKNELIKQRDYLFGEGSLGYVQKMLFAMDTDLVGRFMSLNKHQYSRVVFGKELESLTQGEMEQLNEDWSKYKETRKGDLDTAFSLFQKLQATVNPKVQEIKDTVDPERTAKFLQELSKYKIPDWNVKLEDESDDEFKYRNEKMEGEDDSNYQKRKDIREARYVQKYLDTVSNWLEQINGLKLDRNQFREVQATMRLMRKNIIQDITSRFTLDNPELLKSIRDYLEVVDLDEDNDFELQTHIENLIWQQVKPQVLKLYSGEDGSVIGYDDIWTDVIKPLHNLLTSVEIEDDVSVNYSHLAHILDAIQDKDIQEHIQEQRNNAEKAGDKRVAYYDTVLDYINAFNKLDINQLQEDYNNGNVDIQHEKIRTLTNNINNIFEFGIDKKNKNMLRLLDGFSEWYLNGELANNDIENTLLQIKAISSLEENPRIEKEINKLAIWQSDDIRINRGLDNLISELRSNNIIKQLSTLQNQEFTLNPIESVVNAVSGVSQNKNTNIVEFLEDIYKQYNNGENPSEFILTDEQMQILNQFLKDLDMAEGFIYAATNKPTIPFPIGHNKSMNQFMRNHKDVYGKTEELPELDLDYAAYLGNEFWSFRNEVNKWMELSRQNIGNKPRKFKQCEKAYVNAVSQFFKNNREAFNNLKITLEGMDDEYTLDLLDGFEEPDGTLFGLAKIQQLLYNNLHRFVDKLGYPKGWGISIMSQLLPKLLLPTGISTFDNVLRQQTAKLDETITYDKLTSYDKLRITVNAMAKSPKAFYTELVNMFDDANTLAPLHIQEVAMQPIRAMDYASDLINDAMDYVVQNSTKKNLPVLYNTVISLGLGGAGKTAVVARLSAKEALHSITTGELTGKIWLCGPTTTQLTNLSRNLQERGMDNHYRQFTLDELMNEVFNGKYNDLIESHIEKRNNGSYRWKGIDKVIKIFNLKEVYKDLTSYFKKYEGDEASEAPALIIVDEATLVSSANIQALAEFVHMHNAQLILLGDDHQNDIVYPGLMANLDANNVFAWRSDNLYITLRDTNIQKSKDIQMITQWIDQIKDNFSAVGGASQNAKNLLDNIIPHSYFNYYNKEVFRGTLITQRIPEGLFKKLSGKIAFIGASNSNVYNQLKAVQNDVTLMDPLAVQGQEFDYVIVDKEWTLHNKNLPEYISLFNFLLDFNTMMTRSREGTIFIENGDLGIFKSVENEYTGTSDMRTAVNAFRESRIPTLRYIMENLHEYDEEEEAKEEEVEEEEKKNKGGNPPAPAGGGGTNTGGTGSTNTGSTGTGGTSTGSTNGAPSGTNPSGSTGGGPATNTGGTSTGGTNTGGTSTGSNGTGSTKGKRGRKTGTKGTTTRKSKRGKTTVPEEKTTNVTVKEVLDKERGEEQANTGKSGEPVLDNSGTNQQAQEDDDNKESKHYENVDTPMRVYSNLHFSGIPITGLNQDWVNDGANKSNRDLGIFVQGTISKDDTQKKDQAVRNLLYLKSLLVYGTEFYNGIGVNINEEVQKKFTEKALHNARYSIHVEGLNDSNSLIGLNNTLTNDKRATYKDKLVTLVATIEGKDGQEYQVTIGSLANPETWAKEKDANIESINKRITKLQENEAQNADDISRLKKYINDLPSFVNTYMAFMNDLVARGDGVYEYTGSPEFSKMATLVKTGEMLRLKNIDPSQEGSPWQNMSRYQIRSNVEIVLDKDSPLVGKPVIYGTTAPFIGASQLKKRYWAQKQDASITPLVRMIVLNSMGVSFDSLFQKRYQDIYTVNVGGKSYPNPFESEIMGIRMYEAMWNFRAYLKQFLSVYDEFKSDLEKKKYSENDIIKALEADNAAYLKYRDRIRNEANDKKLMPTETQYHEAYLKEEPESAQKELIKEIWAFNDTTLKSYREFRLGTSSKNGMYLRRIKDQEGKWGNDIGIYIDPRVARDYEQILDKLFNNVLNKIIPEPTNLSPNVTLQVDEEGDKGWFKNIKQKNNVVITFVDYETNQQKRMSGTKHNVTLNSFSGIVSATILAGKYLKYRAIDGYDYDEGIIENTMFPDELKIINAKGEEEKVNWMDIDEVYQEYRVKYNNDKNTDYALDQSWGYKNLGINYVGQDEDGRKWGIVDERVSNLFSMMFHGLTSTKKYNDFTNDEIRATDARFKYGFFADSVLKAKEGEGEENSAATVTDERLFGTNMIFGMPLVSLNIKNVNMGNKTTTTPPKKRGRKTKTTTTTTTTTVNTIVNTAVQALKNMNINIQPEPDTTISMIQDNVNKAVENNIDQSFNDRTAGLDTTFRIEIDPATGNISSTSNLRMLLEDTVKNYNTENSSNITLDYANPEWETESGMNVLTYTSEDETMVFRISYNNSEIHIQPQVLKGTEVVQTEQRETWEDRINNLSVMDENAKNSFMRHLQTAGIDPKAPTTNNEIYTSMIAQLNLWFDSYTEFPEGTDMDELYEQIEEGLKNTCKI